MISRLFSVALPVAVLLGIAAASFLQIARNAPAFSPSLRTESVLGDWRNTQSDALFNASEYYFQLGFGFLQVDTATVIMSDDNLPNLEEFDAQMANAQGLFRASLSHAPGRVDAWTSLAWTALMRDDVLDAEAALRRSWELAPFNVSEAAERLAIVSVLDDFHEVGWRNDDRAREAIEKDTGVLSLFNRAYLQRLPASSR